MPCVYHRDMLDLAKVQCADFAACVNQDFEIVTDAGPLVLNLFEARPRDRVPGAMRDPFTLTFRGPPPLRLPQAIYQMSNAEMGEMEIFLVQIAADQTSSTFEAVFN
ncbi:MAG TPA: hypothetical protein VNP98_06965 [Chthoniobacterales bacterium]|nr:hypothetical protein [Chthoniobacterales bacterium]